MPDLTCECLVVGSGPGGATTALVLAGAGRDVLALEEGIDGKADFVPYSLQEMNMLYRHGGISISQGKPIISYMEGCCLGGASEINAALYHRPLPHMLDQWAVQYRIEDFGAAAIDPFLLANEELLGVALSPFAPGPGGKIIERGAKTLGWKSMEVPRMWNYSVNVPQGQRQSMNRSFIPRAKNAGAKWMTQVRVVKINFRGKEACQAQCISLSDKKYFRVNFKSIFVCGGAVQTPFLLRRSGLTRHIGDRLRMHLSAGRLIARFGNKASDPSEGVPSMQVSEFKPQLTLGGSCSTPAYLALWLADRDDFAELMKSTCNMGIFHAYFIARSQGRVRGLPGQGASVWMNIAGEDLFYATQANGKLARLLFAAGAEIIYSPLPGGKDFRNLAEIEQLCHSGRNSGMDLSTIHLFSSCPMGEDEAQCAVDSFGRVHGTKNVYVNDSSIFPEAPGTNPQALVMALARRNALHWQGCH